MTQTLALLLDAYRDLNARRMFWIVLILSTLVAGSFGALGIDAAGFSVFRWHVNSWFFNSGVISPGDFFKLVFLEYGVSFWLTSFATILALISTASIFPDFIATGAIDLFLSKPIGRLQLFFTKYAFGLLFVALQVTCFCAASFVVIGVRGGAWEPGIFLAVPIVVLFYSYLYSFCVLIGVVTRSTVASVLLTLLFWAALFGVNLTEVGLLTWNYMQEENVNQIDQQIISTQTMIADEQATAATQPTAALSGHIVMLQSRMTDLNQQREQVGSPFEGLHEMFFIAKTLLPKTSETVDLLERKLVEKARLERAEHLRDREQSIDDDSKRRQRAAERSEAQVRVQETLAKRSVSWVVGTSLIFEAVVLGAGAWIFCRRDY